jgi:hypothetical protein
MLLTTFVTARNWEGLIGIEFFRRFSSSILLIVKQWLFQVNDICLYPHPESG